VLDPDLLLRAYSIGVFPMSDSRDAADVFWVEPKRRAILPLDGFRLSRSLRKTIRADAFRVSPRRGLLTGDHALFGAPGDLDQCADRGGFNRLHSLGHAHSIECWEAGELVGGPLRCEARPRFFGESMFSARTDASKVALAWLVARLTVGGFKLLDCQFMTDHLRSLGAIEITQANYVTVLGSALVGASGEFGALDRLLASAGADGLDAPSGWVIAQLLGQTS
jgi:leucyl/phenylalanyl-tRNA--protein transferase